jgi:hypothetical protein
VSEKEIEEIFSLYGHSNMYEKLKNRLMFSNLLDREESEMLESFFAAYDFQQGSVLDFEEFKIHFKVFMLLQEREVLPEVF